MKFHIFFQQKNLLSAHKKDQNNAFSFHMFRIQRNKWNVPCSMLHYIKNAQKAAKNISRSVGH